MQIIFHALKMIFDILENRLINFTETSSVASDTGTNDT